MFSYDDIFHLLVYYPTHFLPENLALGSMKAVFILVVLQETG